MILDIIVVLLLVSGLVGGFRIGFIKQTVQAGSLILAFIVAMYYFQDLGNLIVRAINGLQIKLAIQWVYVIDMVAFICLFSLTQVVYVKIGKHLNGLTRVPGLHLGDELLGSLMGMVTRYLVIFFVLNILIVFPISWVQNQYRESSISQTIVKKTPIISKWQAKHLITHSASKQNLAVLEVGVATDEMAK
ncbi:CvpA family protein [Lentilactobacillus kisonensis]|uniref:CvpA family protein n=2 Tax=Lentilactobacillus kisonensis TaxID=481722 RepID=H1LCJ1_9LACO|nr:CvpA family protein [Lentilactobacillus kisonensis]EHO53970.1 CvpA family protein [Lentilactobacillus kisonensis F0435]KRL21564.1 CvpA family protein [Lentilactobacillus kisonensis DSM 19906 = JCM 15041]